MTVSTVKTENGKVSCETAEGTVVHININQRSAFDCFLDTFRFFRDMKKSGQKTEPAPMSRSASYLGFGVAYISLGLISVIMAILICVTQPRQAIWYTGLHFWVGFPILVSGALNLVAYKFPNKCWMAFSFISLLVNLGVSIAGMVITIGDLQRFRWWSPEVQVCYNLRDGRRDYYGGTRPPPRYGYEYEYDLQQCKMGLEQYKNFSMCFTVMSLLIMIWAVCLTMLSLGWRVKACYRTCSLERAEEKDEALIKPNPADDIIIA